MRCNAWVALKIAVCLVLVLEECEASGFDQQIKDRCISSYARAQQLQLQATVWLQQQHGSLSNIGLCTYQQMRRILLSICHLQVIIQ